MDSNLAELLGFDALTWATLALFVATAILAYMAWGQLKKTAEAAKADHLRRRGEATMRAASEFVTAYSREHTELLKLAREKGISVKDLVNQHQKDKEVSRRVQEQLDALEMLACGARLKIYDENIIFHVTASVVRQLGDRTATLRADLVAGRFDSRPAQPTAYEHVKWLLSRFDKISGEGAIHLDGTLTGVQ